MKKFWRQTIVFTALSLLLIGLHKLLHNYTFSLVILPVAGAALLPYTLSSSAVILLALIIVSELLTAFPPGIMTIIILLPYAIRKLFAAVEVGISGKFYALVAGTVAGQLLILIVANYFLSNSELSLGWKEAWQTVPIKPLLGSFLITSLIVYSLAIIWHEMLLSTPTTSLRKLKRL